MSIDYIEPKKLNKDEKLLIENKITKLAKKFEDSQQDIALAESIIRQEQVEAIMAYKELFVRRKEAMCNRKTEHELFYLDQ